MDQVKGLGIDATNAILSDHGLTYNDLCRSPWDADHVIAVVERGGECGLDNYQTLCCPCHKRKTADLAKRRAALRRVVSDSEVPDSLGGGE